MSAERLVRKRREERKKLQRYFHTRTFSRLEGDFEPGEARSAWEFVRFTPVLTGVAATLTLGVGLFFVFF